MKRHTWKPYVIWVIFSEAVGGLSGWLTRNGMQIYKAEVVKPPLSPPSIVFPIVWVALYALMGISAARIYLAPSSASRTSSLSFFFLQLFFNFFWSILFFNFQRYGLALIWLVMLWALILCMVLSFRNADKLAMWLQVPYLLWVAFAAYLNLGVWLLNRL